MKRVHGIDVVRGLVMALMALDHVRVYSGVPAGSPDPAVFFTRWVTHFCAPAFFLLSGISAHLSILRRGRAQGARQLLIRGATLILLELSVIRVAWTFNLGFDEYLLGGVIWALGWSMILLAGLLWLPRWAIAGLALAIVGLHDHFGALYMTGSPWQESYVWYGRMLYTGGIVELGSNGPVFIILYSLIPWVGVMAAGYALGAVFEMDPRRRDRIVCGLGIGLLSVFLLLRSGDVYGDPRPRSSFSEEWSTLLAFLNTSKYPASLQFLLMTLGPILIAIPLLDRLRGSFGRVLAVFGRVPLFFYLLHIPLIHGLAVLLAWFRSPEVLPWLFGDHPLPVERAPESYRFSLTLLYGFTAFALALLYVACSIYGRRHTKTAGG